MAKKKTSKSKKNLNETGHRSGCDRRSNTESADIERRKTKRRRQIDPTTCEREYNEAEIEFMHALDEYKRASGRMFPTCSEILEVILGLGYRQVAEIKEGFQFEQDDTELADSNHLDDSEEALERELEDQII